MVTKEEKEIFDFFLSKGKFLDQELQNIEGRKDIDMGFADLGNYKGDSRGNLILKAITKAKRRVTLSICGLGMLDETETETIKDKKTYDVDEMHCKQKDENPVAVDEMKCKQKDEDQVAVVDSRKMIVSEKVELIDNIIKKIDELTRGQKTADRIAFFRQVTKIKSSKELGKLSEEKLEEIYSRIELMKKTENKKDEKKKPSFKL